MIRNASEPIPGASGATQQNDQGAACESAAPATPDQPARAQNVQAVVDYFESGIKPADAPLALGIELEHTVVRDGGEPVSYSEQHGIAWLLERLRADYPDATYDADGDILGVARPGEAVTIEPAAQVELSAGPFTSLDDAQRTFDGFERALQEQLGPQGMRALTVGYHPFAKARDLELIPKRRYRFMNLYFEQKGRYGVCMMRGSASTQVSIDYYSQADCLRKLRLAGLASPLFALMCDNASVFEGAPRTRKLVRTKIWQECDPDRCGIVPGSLDEGFTFEDYANYLLDAPAILAPCAKEGFCYTERTFGQRYADAPMTRADVEHMVSMFFNDVRLKTYLEIRPADAMPIPYVIAYAALVKGLFAHEDQLAQLDELFAGLGEADVEAAKEALMAKGYGAVVYGSSAAELCDRLVVIARAGLGPDDQRFLDPLAHLVEERTTLADEAERMH